MTRERYLELIAPYPEVLAYGDEYRRLLDFVPRLRGIPYAVWRAFR